ncbi:MAG: hypothetical protein AAF598_16780 [Bacteroidota bacterium]
MEDEIRSKILDDDWFDGNKAKDKKLVEPIHYTGPTVFRYSVDQRRIRFGASAFPVPPGTFAWIDDQPVSDGFYRLLASPHRIEVWDGLVQQVHLVMRYQSLQGQSIEVDLDRKSKPVRAWMDDQAAPDGWYHRKWVRWIRVRDGRVIGGLVFIDIK